MITYAYDDNGNLLTKTDARNVTATYAYDALNRAISRSYSDSTPTVTYVYDSTSISNGKGRLASVSNSVSGYSYSGYDATGKAIGISQSIGGQNYSMAYSYGLAGHVTSMTYPSGRVVSYNYDNAGRLADNATHLAFTGNLGDGTTRTYAKGVSYGAAGQMTQEQFGTTTAVFNKLFYNSRGQLAEVLAATTGNDTSWNRGKMVNDYSLQCSGAGCDATDNNGNLRKQTVFIPNNEQNTSSTSRYQQYDYDSLNRLQRVHEYTGNTSLDWQQEYLYDRWGNRLVDTSINKSWGGGINNKSFTVSPTNNRLAVPSGQSGAISYDSAGNMTTDTYSGSGVTRVYDAENRMTQETTYNGVVAGTYSYDGDGRRVKRLVGVVETWQVYGLTGELLAEYAANGAPANPQKEYGYRNGELLVTTETISGGGGAQPVTWTSAVGVSVSGNNLTKTAAEGWGNAGASSSQSIASGDGYVESTVSGSNNYRLFGLSKGDSHQNYSDIDFAFYPALGSTLYIYEGGVSRGTFGTYATGDVLRVAVEGSVVKYRKNGVLLYTSTVAPAYPLLVDTAFYSPGSTITNAMISAGSSGGPTTQNASWTNAVGVAVNGNNLTKTAGEGWGNAGASSSQSISSGDGYAESTISESSNYRLFGLSKGDSHQNYSDIDFAFYPALGSTLYIYEGGVSKGTFGAYATGDVLRVAVEGGVVKYRKNGVLLYTSTAAPAYPLLVDTAFYSVGSTINNVVISGTLIGGGGGSTTQVRWLVTDHLGTPRMIFDQSGSLTVTDQNGNYVSGMTRHDYLPFGEEVYAGTGGRTPQQGYTASDNLRQKFTAKERDGETGLDYFEARYYESEQGRFTSPDPLYVELRRLSDPQRINLYTYVRDNPIRYTDHTGLDITITGKDTQSLADDLNNRKDAQFKVALDKKGVVQVIDKDKVDVNKLNKSEKALYNAIIDPNNHAVLDGIGKSAPVDFGAFGPGVGKPPGTNEIDVADMNLLRKASATAAGESVAHEALEAYESAKTGSMDYRACHAAASKFFPEPTFAESSLPGESGKRMRSGYSAVWSWTKINVSVTVTYQFQTPLPIESLRGKPQPAADMTSIKVKK